MCALARQGGQRVGGDSLHRAVGQVAKNLRRVAMPNDG